MALPKTKRKKKRGSRKKSDVGPQPNWPEFLEKNPTVLEIYSYHSSSMQWYNYNHHSKDLRKDVELYLKNNKYTKTQIQKWKAAENWRTGITVSCICKMLNEGMPEYITNPYKTDPKYDHSYDEDYEPYSSHTWIQEKLSEVIEHGGKAVAENKKEEKANANKYVPTIQERIQSQALSTAEDIDEWLDGFVMDKKNFDPKGFDFKTHFQQRGVTQAHARKLIKFYESELAEMHELQQMPTPKKLEKMDESDSDMWEQLKEGYSHLTKKDVQKFTSALEVLIEACTFVIESSKATRKPRKAKPKSADKLIAKLKYCRANDKYKLASINPVDIIGSNELWVFNIKTRKIGKYIANNQDPKGLARTGTGLQAKGTTITGFNLENSYQKTLRKPDDQLKEFKASGKVALRTFMDSINTTDTRLTGRINVDTVLLKVT
mgnify:CR=1 FL=1